jgi:hypothetical protein
MRALERTGYDCVELQLHGVEHMGQLKTVALAVLVERALAIENRVGAPQAGAGMTKDKKIHRPITL